MKRYMALSGVIRVLLALVFIFSGFVKGVDPWGTAIKLNEYFQAFGLDFLSGARYAFSVILSAAEMLLGFCLLFRLGGRLTGRIALWFMVLFTALTLVLALWNPVSDCGCFGDAVKLTNWQTFYKNIILLLFAVVVVRADRPPKDTWSRPRTPEHGGSRIVEFALGFCFLLFSLGVGLYSLRHLPIIDFLPYKAGVHLASGMQTSAQAGAREAILIYRDRNSGQEHEFSLQDTTWHDSLRWEFVDTRFVDPPQAASPQAEVLDFSVFDEQGDVAAGWLASDGPWFLITLGDLSPLGEACRERYADLLAYSREQSIPVYAATSVSLPEERSLVLGGEQVPLFNIDGTMLKTLIRAHRGLVLFQDGTLLAKWNCRDIPRFSERYAGRGVLSLLAEAPVQARLSWLLGVIGAVLLLTYAVYFIHRGSCRNR